MRHIFIKVIISLLLCVGIISNSKSQVKTKIFNEGIPDKFIPIHKLIIPEKVIIEPTEFTGLLNKTQSTTENLKEYSDRFAVPAEVDLDVLANAKVTEEKGITTFALTIHAKKASNISLQFNNFLLSEHSVLSIYTKNELTDSITANENTESKVWATRVYQGNKLTLILKLPTNERIKTKLNINRVNFGFKKFGTMSLT